MCSLNLLQHGYQALWKYICHRELSGRSQSSRRLNKVVLLGATRGYHWRRQHRNRTGSQPPPASGMVALRWPSWMMRQWMSRNDSTLVRQRREWESFGLREPLGICTRTREMTAQQWGRGLPKLLDSMLEPFQWVSIPTILQMRKLMLTAGK